MKGKTKKFLSVLLTMMLVCTASILPAMQGVAKDADPAAALPKVEMLTVTEVTDTSITLGKPSLKDGKDASGYIFEYSLNGGKYDKEHVFKQLTPETVYVFRVRIAAGTYNGVEYKNAGAESAPLEVTTNKSAASQEQTQQEEQKQLEEQKQQEEQARQEALKQQEEQARQEALKQQEEQARQEALKQQEEQARQEALKQQEEQARQEALKQQEEQKQPEEQTKQEEQKQPEEQTKQEEQKQPEEQVKQEEQKQPEEQTKQEEQKQPEERTKQEAPKLESRTDTSIILEAVSGQEYALVDAKGEKWQASNEFTGLTPDTAYSFVARIGASETEPAGKKSDPAEFKTKKAAAAAPDAPVITARTDKSITLEEKANQRYAILTSDGSEVWQDSGVFEGLTADTKYQFITRVKFNPDEAMPSKSSEPAEGRTKKAAATAPAAPVLQDRTDTTITLKTRSGLEYTLLSDGNPGTWQESGAFTGLTPNTWYEFAARNKFDPDKEAASEVSQVLKVKTYIAFNGSIEGIKEGATYYVDDTLNITAVGTGMDNAAPVAGDSRWRPINWTWDKESYKSWDKAPFTVSATLAKTGNFQLAVTYQLEAYDGSAWNAVNSKETLQKNFKVDLRTYVITASADKNGSIAPNGKVEVKHGKDQTFKFTPNKGYGVAKVYVDGAEVKFKNNAYTFSDVKKDHKISVTFAKLTTVRTPKTGDMETNILLWLLPLALAGAVIVAVAVRHKRLKK